MSAKGTPIGAMDAAINGRTLANYMLQQDWHKCCHIIPDYEPPYPRPGDRKRCIVRFNNGTKYPAYLRHSLGPLQGFSWDIYGDDMLSVELAILALSQAPYPISGAPIKFPISLRNKEEQ